jgi:glycosyltransferase involved in cell wall biosynthesis
MRILQVIPYFYPAFAFGGPVQVVYDISKKLVERGHDFVVYTTDAKDVSSRLDNNSGEIDYAQVHYFRNISMVPVKMFKLFVTPSLLSTVKKDIRSFNIIHLHEYRTFQNIVLAHYAKKYGIPYVIHAHGSLPRVTAKRNLKWFYDVLFGYSLLRGASKVIALGQMEAKQYIAMGVAEEKIEIIANGIDLSQYVKLPKKGFFQKKFNLPADKKIILYLGRINKTKGIEFLLKAYAHFINAMKFEDTLLVIAGPDDGYLDTVKHITKSLKISDNVIFTGILTEKEKISAYVDASIVVNVEPKNVFGLVPLEAAACTTLVIVSKGNAISSEVNQGKFGFSVSYNDVSELAGIMEKIFNNNILLMDMGQNGRKFVFENHDWAKIVLKIENMYKRTIRSNQ